MQIIYLGKPENSLNIKTENFDMVIYAEAEVISYLIDIFKIINHEYLETFLEFIIKAQNYVIPSKVFFDIYMAIKIDNKMFTNYLRQLKVHISMINFGNIEEIKWILTTLENFKIARLLINDLENYIILIKYIDYLERLSFNLDENNKKNSK